MKVVLDTNVLINGFKDEYSYEKRIIDEVRKGGLEAFANNQTLRENRLLLAKNIESSDYRQELAEFFSQITPVINRRQVSVVRDPEDNKILESAVESKAEFLITSDNDLLQLETYEDVKIVNPQEFWARYKDEGNDLWRQWTNFITQK